MRQRSLLLFLSFCACVLLAGCGAEEETEEDEYADQDAALIVADSRFGDPYEIVTKDYPSSHEVPPGLTSDSLFVMVGYYGGCADHEFSLHQETAADTSRFWVEHSAPRDDCDEYIREDLSFEAPTLSNESSTVVLLNPQGYEPHILRW